MRESGLGFSGRAVGGDSCIYIMDAVEYVALPVGAEGPGVDGDDFEAHGCIRGLFVGCAAVVVVVAGSAVVFDVGREFGKVEIGSPDLWFLGFLDQKGWLVDKGDGVAVEELCDFPFAVRLKGVKGFRSISTTESCTPCSEMA